jgi:hypothetical protein
MSDFAAARGGFQNVGAVADPQVQRRTWTDRWDAAWSPNITIQWSPAKATSTPVEFLLLPYAERGDVNGDGKGDLQDAVEVPRSTEHAATPISWALVAGDVRPYGARDGGRRLVAS